MRNYRALVLVLLDVLLILLAGWLALIVRFDFLYSAVPAGQIAAWRQYLPIQILTTVAIFYVGHMYRFVWHAVSATDVTRMICMVLIANLFNAALQSLCFSRLPLGVYFAELVLQLVFLCGIRCSFRFLDAVRQLAARRGVPQRILVIGGGAAGGILLRELQQDGADKAVCCIIDDNAAKRGRYLEGVRIYGGRDRIGEAVEKFRVNEIIFAIPSASPDDRRDILSRCAKTGCRVLTMPSIRDSLDWQDEQITRLSELKIEDLLGRDPVRLDERKIRSFIEGKTVLVTGGGGSIGSELCRQIAANRPRRLIILDIYENNAYDIQQELVRRYGRALDLCVEIASVRDKEKIDAIFDAYRPEVVFHAAAHKHVPLMENNPDEAVKNNIFGTYHVVRASEKFGVKRFVMISTDKAVNPTNIMGATKRFCEMILQSRGKSETEFCAVRFGNVLGSNGSVVPLFEKQIAEGGPVTITDKRITRFFMTIPEAVQLVLECAAMAENNQIFVLDMGKPVTILSLAENMIRLHGMEPYKDIDIVEIGLRPGEKLYEELLMSSNRLHKLSNNKIFVEEPESISAETVLSDLRQLGEALSGSCTAGEISALLREMVPTYRTPEEANGEIAAYGTLAE